MRRVHAPIHRLRLGLVRRIFSAAVLKGESGLANSKQIRSKQKQTRRKAG